MESAAEALQMAAAVLIFVLALSISINAFGQVRQTSQIILDYKDREYDYTYVDENKDNEGNSVTERWVGIESILPNIYKSYKENNKIVFDISDIDCLYTKKVNGSFDDPASKIKYIDLEKENIGSEVDKRKFINAIIYGYGSDNNIFNQFEKRQIRLTKNGIYNTIKGNIYKETIGVYKQEEINSTDSTIPTNNENKKRIITYSDS